MKDSNRYIPSRSDSESSDRPTPKAFQYSTTVCTLMLSMYVALSMGRFSDHIGVMFGEESPPWDRERHYTLSTIEVFARLRLTRVTYHRKNYLYINSMLILGKVLSSLSRCQIVHR